jgi:polyhydroxyalkanoate synthesis regulator phasin
MLALLKNGLLLALGSGILVKETLEGLSGSFEGTLLTGGASSITKDLAENLRKDIALVQTKGIKKMEQLSASAGLLSKNDFETLEKRVASLEKAAQK